jgi:ribosomal protein L29
MKIRGGLASGGVPENVGKTREIKRTIARILTKKREEALKRNDLS